MSVISVFQLVNMAPKKRKLQLEGQTNLATFFNNRATDTKDNTTENGTGSTTPGPKPPNNSNSKTKPQIKVNIWIHYVKDKCIVAKLI